MPKEGARGLPSAHAYKGCDFKSIFPESVLVTDVSRKVTLRGFLGVKKSRRSAASVDFPSIFRPGLKSPHSTFPAKSIRLRPVALRLSALSLLLFSSTDHSQTSFVVDLFLRPAM